MSLNEDTCIQDSVLVKFIDEGKTELVKRDQLLQLPEHFHTLPPQAVEFIVCRVKPADNEVEWNPKVSASDFWNTLNIHRIRVLYVMFLYSRSPVCFSLLTHTGAHTRPDFLQPCSTKQGQGQNTRQVLQKWLSYRGVVVGGNDMGS